MAVKELCKEGEKAPKDFLMSPADDNNCQHSLFGLRVNMVESSARTFLSSNGKRRISGDFLCSAGVFVEDGECSNVLFLFGVR